MKQPRKIWKILIGLVVFLLHVQLSYADMPKIELRFSFSDKKEKIPYYQYDENIKVTVLVENKSSEDIVISEGFSLKNFYGEMRLIDPSGSLILPKSMEKKPDNTKSHVPPLGYIQHENKLIRAAPCEIFRRDDKIMSYTNNLTGVFNMPLPGYYSAQIQFSIIRFKEDICDIDNLVWQGLLKSDTKYFFYEGKTKIEIDPREWETAWIKYPPRNPFKVKIFYDNKITIKNIDRESIRLNNSVKPLGIEREEKNYLVYFNPLECLERIQLSREKQSYPIIISGKLNNGKKFGGAQRIRLVR